MRKMEFLQQTHSKEKAIKYFPVFFDNKFNILYDDKTLNDLEKEFLDYCRDAFVTYGGYSATNRNNIISAYDYLKSMLENSQKTCQLKYPITNSVLHEHDELIELISEYRFIARYNDSYGANQNKTNKKILFEISLFRPFLVKVLKNIDSYFERITDITEVSAFDNSLMEQMCKLLDQLMSNVNELNCSKKEYQKIWNSTFRSGYTTEKDLGESKNGWKKDKNSACSFILNFYKEMLDIDKSLGFEFTGRIFKHGDIKALYDNCIDNIVHGPNYYSYLSEKERKELTEGNKKRKLRVRQ